MEGVGTKDKRKTGFFYCPCCGLRIPKSEMSRHFSGFCPACGIKMIEEGSLPYVSRLNILVKNNSDSKILEENNMDTVNSINWFNRQKASDMKVQIFPGDETIDISEEMKRIRRLTEAILVNPNDTELYFTRATLRVKIGDIEGARKDFKLSEICHNKKKLELEDYPLV